MMLRRSLVTVKSTSGQKRLPRYSIRLEVAEKLTLPPYRGTVPPCVETSSFGALYLRMSGVLRSYPCPRSLPLHKAFLGGTVPLFTTVRPTQTF